MKLYTWSTIFLNGFPNNLRSIFLFPHFYQEEFLFQKNSQDVVLRFLNCSAWWWSHLTIPIPQINSCLTFSVSFPPIHKDRGDQDEFFSKSGTEWVGELGVFYSEIIMCVLHAWRKWVNVCPYLSPTCWAVGRLGSMAGLRGLKSPEVLGKK